MGENKFYWFTLNIKRCYKSGKVMSPLYLQTMPDFESLIHTLNKLEVNVCM